MEKTRVPVLNNMKEYHMPNMIMRDPTAPLTTSGPLSHTTGKDVISQNLEGKKCSKCGCENANNARFCVKCGNCFDRFRTL